MLLRCWDLWYRLLRYMFVTLLRSLGSCTTLHTCCYAAEISGIIYYVTCCYAAEISGIVYYVTCCYAAEISGIVYYVTYMLLRCWDLWYRLLRYKHVATLLRSLGSFTTLHTCCYAAEISGIVYYVTCCYAAEISGIVYYVTYMLLRCWDLWDLWELGNGDAFTRMLLASCLLRMRCSDDAEKRKNAPQVFPGFPIIKLARHCGKITIFFKCAFYGNGFRSGGMFMPLCLRQEFMMHVESTSHPEPWVIETLDPYHFALRC